MRESNIIFAVVGIFCAVDESVGVIRNNARSIVRTPCQTGLNAMDIGVVEVIKIIKSLEINETKRKKYYLRKIQAN